MSEFTLQRASELADRNRCGRTECIRWSEPWLDYCNTAVHHNIDYQL